MDWDSVLLVAALLGAGFAVGLWWKSWRGVVAAPPVPLAPVASFRPEDACRTLQIQLAADKFGRGISRWHGAIGELVEALVALGMAHRSAAPELPTYDLNDGGYLDTGYRRSAAAQEFEARLKTIRAQHGSFGARRIAGIPSHKFGAGAGWRVTAAECAEALAAYETAISGGAAEPWAFRMDFVPFLQEAARHEGFRVI